MAEDWPQFRGPTGQGLAPQASPPTEFGERQNLTWKTPIPGQGWSSPVISGNEIWLTSAIPDSAIKNRWTLAAILLDAETGRIEQTIPLFELDQPEAIHADNTYASPTPVLDADRVYCHFGTFGTAAVSRAERQTKWKNTSLQIEHQGGPGSSPILAGDHLILACDGADAQYVIALDPATGKTVWRRDRSAPLRPDPITRRAFATPLLWNRPEGNLLISPAADQVHAYRPDTGEEVWHVRYTGFSNVPAPVADDEHVYLCTGFFEPALIAIRPDGRGDVTQTHVTWFVNRGISTVPSPIVAQDSVFHLTEGGILTRFDTRTGKVLRKRRVIGNYSASPIYAGGMLYFCSHEGKITVVEPNDRLDIAQVNRIEGRIKASPAALGHRLYIRSDTHLYAFDRPVEPTPR